MSKKGDSSKLADFSYTQLSHLNDTWDAVRRVPDYEVTTGKAIFSNLFETCPETKSMFGFSSGDNAPDAELIFKSRRFLMHASYMVQMIDTALTMMGPGSDILEEILEELGGKHARYGVVKEMYSFMCQAIVHAVQTVSEKKFDPEVKEAWSEFLRLLTMNMARAGRIAMQKKNSMDSTK